MRVYVDMDGVVADFEGGYLRLTGETTMEAAKFGMDHFWAPVNEAGEPFWEGLDELPEGRKLMEWLFSHVWTQNIKFLSAPSRATSSRIGKYAWVAEHFPGTYVILDNYKEKHANEGCVLIDDNKVNVDKFKAKGGKAILWSGRFEDILPELKEILSIGA